MRKGYGIFREKMMLLLKCKLVLWFVLVCVKDICCECIWNELLVGLCGLFIIEDRVVKN